MLGVVLTPHTMQNIEMNPKFTSEEGLEEFKYFLAGTVVQCNAMMFCNIGVNVQILSGAFLKTQFCNSMYI